VICLSTGSTPQYRSYYGVSTTTISCCTTVDLTVDKIFDIVLFEKIGHSIDVGD
jgi:hypothetical protein